MNIDTTGNVYDLDPVLRDPISNGLPLRGNQGDRCPSLWPYYEDVQPLNGASTFYTVQGNGFRVGTRIDTGTYRLVYTSTDLANLDNATDRATLMYRIIHWLTNQRGVDLGEDHFSVGQPGSIVSYNMTVNNTGILNETFDLNLTGNIWNSTILDETASFNITNVTLQAGEEKRIVVEVEIQ